jgi:AcrR family transcriptional regulator
MKSAKGKKRAEEILDAATQILVEEGYGGFSMRRVAETLSIRLSNVQYYFGGPGELLSALFDRALERSITAFKSRPAQGSLEDLIRFILDEQQPQEYCLMFWELWALAARDEEINAVMARYYAQYQKQIEYVLSKAVPGLAPGARRRRAVLIMSLMEGLSLFRGVEGRLDIPARQLDKDVVEAVIRIAAG